LFFNGGGHLVPSFICGDIWSFASDLTPRPRLPRLGHSLRQRSRRSLG
jgi:hypothetical protein